MKADFVIVGCGYTGRQLAPLLLEYGPVAAIARNQQSMSGLPAAVHQCVSDLNSKRAASLTQNAVVIYLAPPPAQGDTDTTLASFIARLKKLKRFVYTSTSGVYGDCGGALVDESRAAAPLTARAIRRHSAETQLHRWCDEHDCPLVVLRVAGIYGPGRLPLQRIRHGEPVLRDEDAMPGNRIHVSDLAISIVAAATTKNPPVVVNVSDGNHASSSEFTRMVASAAGLPQPPSVSLDKAREVFTSMRWSFLAESRRLDNSRLTTQLGVKLRYADLSAGIANALDETRQL